MVQFADSQFQIMHEDSRLDTRPIIVDVTGKSSEIETTVDPYITYGKVELFELLVIQVFKSKAFRFTKLRPRLSSEWPATFLAWTRSTRDLA